MSLQKDLALNNIQEDFENLCNLVLEQLDLLERIITSGKIGVKEETLKAIKNNEKTIDQKEVKLSEKIVNTIVLHQPADLAETMRQMLLRFFYLLA